MVEKSIPPSHIRGGGRRGNIITGSEPKYNGGTGKIKEADRKHMPIISLAPLSLVSSLFTHHLLAPPAAYTFVEARAVVIHLPEDSQPLLA